MHCEPILVHLPSYHVCPLCGWMYLVILSKELSKWNDWNLQEKWRIIQLVDECSRLISGVSRDWYWKTTIQSRRRIQSSPVCSYCKISCCALLMRSLHPGSLSSILHINCSLTTFIEIMFVKHIRSLILRHSFT